MVSTTAVKTLGAELRPKGSIQSINTVPCHWTPEGTNQSFPLCNVV